VENPASGLALREASSAFHVLDAVQHPSNDMPFASGEKALLTENGQSNRKGKEFPAANWRESQASDKFKEGFEGKSGLPIAFGFVRFNEQQFCLREFTVGAYDASGFVPLPRAIVPSVVLFQAP
jgi:hypothetical protein